MPVSWNDTGILSVHYQYLGYRARVSEEQGICSFILSVAGAAAEEEVKKKKKKVPLNMPRCARGHALRQRNATQSTHTCATALLVLYSTLVHVVRLLVFRRTPFSKRVQVSLPCRPIRLVFLEKAVR